jgi:D-3-phosphoglycerate dehydrogenase
MSSGIEELNVELGGDVAEYPSQPITISILKGILTPVVQENVNFVNALLVAKERGIKVKQSFISESSDYTNLISIRVASHRDSWEVHGSIFGKKEPLIVRVNQFNLEAHPEGNIILVLAEDRPGVIGSIGIEMGENNINIAHMEFGREKVGGKSLLFLNIDSEAPAEVLAKLKELPNINSVRQLKIEI